MNDNIQPKVDVQPLPEAKPDPHVAAMAALTGTIANYDKDKDGDEVAQLITFPVGVQPTPTAGDFVYRLALTNPDQTEVKIEEGVETSINGVSMSELKTATVPRTNKIFKGTTGVNTIISHVIEEIMLACTLNIVKRNAEIPVANSIEINKLRTAIAAETRRGVGNFVIGNQAMIDEVKTYNPDDHTLMFCVADQVEDNTLIIAYRGGSQIDAGIIVAPLELRSAADPSVVKYDLLVSDAVKSYYKIIRFQ